MARYYLMIMFSLLVVVPGLSQDEELESFDTEQWEEITKDIDYIREEKKPENKRKPDSYDFADWGNMFSGMSEVAQVMVVALFVILLVLIISKLLGSNLRLKSVKMGSSVQTIEDVEERLMETDLIQWLKSAVNERNYRLALRIYYLIIIKELTKKEWISWKKEKTNMDYLYEMRGKESYEQFEEITGIYQLVWYGEKQYSDKELTRMSHKFKDYYQFLNTTSA